MTSYHKEGTPQRRFQADPRSLKNCAASSGSTRGRYGSLSKSHLQQFHRRMRVNTNMQTQTLDNIWNERAVSVLKNQFRNVTYDNFSEVFQPLLVIDALFVTPVSRFLTRLSMLVLIVG